MLGEIPYYLISPSSHMDMNLNSNTKIPTEAVQGL